MVLAIPITINHSYLGPRRERCPKIAQQCDRLSNLVIKGVPRGRDSRSVVNGLNNRTSSFRGGDDVSRVWSWVMFSLILDTNLGVWPFTICRMPGPNSWRRLIPASLPIVEPKVLNVADGDRARDQVPTTEMRRPWDGTRRAERDAALLRNIDDRR